jgi:hypothetical protein
MKKLGSVILSMALLSLPVSGMAAYQGGDVKDGGTISGTVKFKGTAPAPKKLDVRRTKRFAENRPKRIRPWWSAMVISRMP